MKLYFLRHADFLPEELNERAYETLRYPSAEIAREQLAKAGNLFTSFDDASVTSTLVRGLLENLSLIARARR